MELNIFYVPVGEMEASYEELPILLTRPNEQWKPSRASLVADHFLYSPMEKAQSKNYVPYTLHFIADFLA